jgi:SUMO ligase MMS21 Smc5/6 complex component
VLTVSDFTSLADVEHHFVDLIKWKDENEVKRELRIYSKIAHRWFLEINRHSTGVRTRRDRIS